MELYTAVVALVRDYLADGIFISVLVIILCRVLFKNRFDTRYHLLITSWILIFYAVLLLSHHLLVIAFAGGKASFLAQAIGSYSYVFWLTLLTTTLLPFLLLFRTLRSKTWLIFTIALLMNIDWLMNSLVIHIVSMNRDFGDNRNPYLPSPNELFTIVDGLLVGIAIMLIGNLTMFRKTRVGH